MFDTKQLITRSTFTTALVILAMLASACGEATEDGDNTDGNNTGDESRYDRPAETLDFISDDQIDDLVEAGAVIHEGDNPPGIAGVYDVNGGEVAFDDNADHIGRTDLCTYIWAVEATDESHVFTTSGELYGACSGEGEGTASYISGADNCFSLYAAGSGTREDCELSTVSIISGCMVDGNIDEFVSAELALERSGSACQSLIEDGGISPEGDRVIVERGLVEQVEQGE